MMQQNWLRLGVDQALNIMINRKKDIVALAICWWPIIFSRVGGFQTKDLLQQSQIHEPSKQMIAA